MAKKSSTNFSLAFGNGWNYTPAPETAEVNIKPKYDLFINGKFIAPAEGNYFETINPATEKKLASVALATEADVNKAVRAARNAYNNVWSKMPGSERGNRMASGATWPPSPATGSIGARSGGWELPSAGSATPIP